MGILVISKVYLLLCTVNSTDWYFGW